MRYFLRNTALSFVLLAVLLGSFGNEVRLARALPPQDNHCDPELRQSTDDTYGYHLRGDRCEGIYIRKVAATTFVASLTESFEDFDPASQNLLVEWTTPSKASVHVRAYALRQKVYYRMDSLRPSGSNQYTWSPNLLATLNLRKNDLGVVAWIPNLIGNRDVYLPLRIKQKSTTSRSSSYQLVLLPGEEFAEVFISLAPVKTDGSPGVFIKKDQPLGYGYYPTARGIRIDIPQLSKPGIYDLEIGATLRAGGSWTTQVLFYHHG